MSFLLGTSNSHTYSPTPSGLLLLLGTCIQPLSPASQVGQLFSAEHPSRAPSLTALQILPRPPAAAGGGVHRAPSGTPRSDSHFDQGSKLFAPNTPTQERGSINIS